jgi:putative hemolysin
MAVFYFAVTLVLLASFVSSVCEAALLTLSHSQVERLGDSAAGRILRQFKREIDVPIAAILILNTVAHTAGASAAGVYFVDAYPDSPLWLFSLVFTTAVLTIGEIIPKTMGVHLAEPLAKALAYYVQFLIWVFRPVIVVTRAMSKLLMPGKRPPVTSLEEIRLLASLGHSEGVLGARFAGIIHGAAQLRELKARDVMVPRAGVAYLSGERSLEENLRVVRNTGHSRFPFTRTGELDSAEGVVVVKDLMYQLRETPDDPHWDELMSPVVVVPGATPLDRLLRRFQVARRHLAIVVDEYGGTQGIVTLEDVLEEIVGEIEDESDRVNRFIIKRQDGSLLCKGWAEARKVLDQLGVEDDVEAVTIGGLVAEQVGRVPKVGDVVIFRGLEFRVTQASPRRAEQIQVSKAQVRDPSLPPPRPSERA